MHAVLCPDADQPFRGRGGLCGELVDGREERERGAKPELFDELSPSLSVPGVGVTLVLHGIGMGWRLEVGLF
ncbi:MAG: hypothetical protein VX738_01570 [Planctomycetota bacterium]|nr:hypothetical protein [Planctomycetota bacterium]